MNKTRFLMACLGLFAVSAQLNRVAAMSSAEMQSIVGGAPCYIYKFSQCAGVVGGCKTVECMWHDFDSTWQCEINERRKKKDDYENATLATLAGDVGQLLLADPVLPDPSHYYCVQKESCVAGVACEDGFIWREAPFQVAPGIWITIYWIETAKFCKGAIPLTDEDPHQLYDLDGDECTVPPPPL